MNLYQAANGEIQKSTTVLLPVALLDESKRLGINRAEVCREALRAAIARRTNDDKVRAHKIGVQKAPTTPYTEAVNGHPNSS